MKLIQILTSLVSNNQTDNPNELSPKDRYKIELLEQRIMFSATQYGAAWGADGFDIADADDVSEHDNIKDMVSWSDDKMDSKHMEKIIDHIYNDDSSDEVMIDETRQSEKEARQEARQEARAEARAQAEAEAQAEKEERREERREARQEARKLSLIHI